MRISARKTDAGYGNYLAAKQTGQSVTVFLDDQEICQVIEADTEKGYVEFYPPGSLSPVMLKLYKPSPVAREGKVRIEIEGKPLVDLVADEKELSIRKTWEFKGRFADFDLIMKQRGVVQVPEYDERFDGRSTDEWPVGSPHDVNIDDTFRVWVFQERRTAGYREVFCEGIVVERTIIG